MDHMIKFLSEIPQFGGGQGPPNSQLLPNIESNEKSWAWTKTALSRLSYYFKKVNYRRGNIVYKAGDECKFIYIVYEGEFELSKTVYLKENEEQSFQHSKYLFKHNKNKSELSMLDS